MKYIRKARKFVHQELEYVFVKHGLAHYVEESEHRVILGTLVISLPFIFVLIMGFFIDEKSEVVKEIEEDAKTAAISEKKD